jgi:(2S)-methylsuccinyl-CoA dehydrogenase
VQLEALAIEVDAERTALYETAAPVLRADGIDAHQVLANALAWGVAHAEAAVATIEWAKATGDPLAAEVAAAAAREALAELAGRKLADDRDAAIHESIAERYRSLVELGATEEQRLLCRTLREFAGAEIAPVAGDVHRQDLDVPEEVITHLRELGVFGQSVPVEYGGSQVDGEDFEGMLIATEELSSASLAVGGSLITRPEILIRALRAARRRSRSSAGSRQSRAVRSW